MGAGLVTGLSHFQDPWSVALALVGGAIVLQQPIPFTLAMTFFLGTASGRMVALNTEYSCAQTIPLGETQLKVVSVDPAVSAGRVRVLGLACHGEVMARWPRTVALPAGLTISVTGRWRPRNAPLGRPDGTLVVSVVNDWHGSPNLIDKSRTHVATVTAKYFGDQAALVDALIAGRRGALDPEIRESFAAAGIVHLLAISGFHVGLLAAWLLLTLRLLGAPAAPARTAAAVATLCYAAWLGWPPSATRAAAMLTVLTFTRLRQRAVRPAAIIGASAMVMMLLDPWAISRLGAWLSLAAISGVIWTTRWASQYPVRYHTVRDGVAASIGATIATAPIASLTLGRVALIGPLVNLVAVPLVALALPALLLTVVLDPIVPLLASGFATSGAALLSGLGIVADLAERLPGAATTSQPGVARAIPWLVLLLAAVWLSRRKLSVVVLARRIGWSFALLIWVTLVPGIVAMPVGRGRLTLHFLDVGQGDAIAIESPGGHWIVVDAGPSDQRWDAGAKVVVPALKRAGAKRVEAFVLSHAHRDHVGGSPTLLREIPVGLILDPGEPFGDSAYHQLLTMAAADGIRWRRIMAGDCWLLDGITFRVLHPAPNWPGNGLDLNEDSVVLMVSWSNFSALLTGDAGIAAESSYIADVGKIDLLKVGHHGSRGATGLDLLKEAAPLAAVISSGRNLYGHPSPEALGRLRQQQVSVWRTDREGSVVVSTDGKTFTVRGGRTTVTFNAGQPNDKDSMCSIKPK